MQKKTHSDYTDILHLLLRLHIKLPKESLGRLITNVGADDLWEMTDDELLDKLETFYGQELKRK